MFAPRAVMGSDAGNLVRVVIAAPTVHSARTKLAEGVDPERCPVLLQEPHAQTSSYTAIHVALSRRTMSKSSPEPSPLAAGIVVLLLAAGGVSALFSGCGGGDDTGAAPDVRGLTLPTAKAELKKQRYSADVKAEGLGVLIEANWTVCSQKKPKGRLVLIEVSKDDC